MKRASVRAHLAALAASVAPKSLEDVCLHCGRCCRLLVIDHGHPRLTGLRCPHQTEAGECSRYETRLEVETCMPLLEAIVKGVQPAGCPYVRGIAGYTGPIAEKRWPR